MHLNGNSKSDICQRSVGGGGGGGGGARVGGGGGLE